MTSVDYTCRFCGTKRTFETDLSPVSIGGAKVNLGVWLENLCCNRCGDYHKARARLRERIIATAHFLILARAAGPKSPPEIESVCKAKLGRFARELNTLVAAHYYREDLYDDQFGEAYFKFPDKVNLCMRKQINAVIGEPELAIGHEQ